MKKTIYRYYCDICGEELKDLSMGNIGLAINVLFTTEQTEGREVEPYYQKAVVDLCEGCTKVYDNSLIRGEGAQGNNRYYFNRDD